MAQRGLFVALSIGLLNRSLILEGSAGFTVANFAVFGVAEKLAHGLALLALVAPEGKVDTLDHVGLVGLCAALLVLILFTSER